MTIPPFPDHPMGESFDEGTELNTSALVDIAAALGWRAPAVERLLTEPETHDALRQIVAVGADLRAVASVPDGSIARWRAAVDAEVRAAGASASEAAIHRKSSKARLGVADTVRSLVAGMGAAATMLFALLSTGAWRLGSPTPVLAVATLVGVFACARELTRSPSEGTLLPPRNRRPVST